MGMRDESWCQSCGCSITYGQEECGDCANDGHYQDKIKLINYMKLHLISLEQDSEELAKEMDKYMNLESDEYKDLEINDISLNGQIFATRHLLSVAYDTLAVPTEEK